MTKPRIKLPDTRQGRRGDRGQDADLPRHGDGPAQGSPTARPIPRSIINTFTAKFAGQEVFTAELHPGISANPYLAFFMKVPGPGEFEFTWIEDGGKHDRREAEAQRRLRRGAASQAGHFCAATADAIRPAQSNVQQEVGGCRTSQSAPRRAPTRSRWRPGRPTSGAPAGARPSSPSATARTRRPASSRTASSPTARAPSTCAAARATDDKPFCDGTHNVL